MMATPGWHVTSNPDRVARTSKVERGPTYSDLMRYEKRQSYSSEQLGLGFLVSIQTGKSI